jgi:hypothetical protein
MLTNENLSEDLEALGRTAGELARRVQSNGDLEPHQLAGGLVEVERL